MGKWQDVLRLIVDDVIALNALEFSDAERMGRVFKHDFGSLESLASRTAMAKIRVQVGQAETQTVGIFLVEKGLQHEGLDSTAVCLLNRWRDLRGAWRAFVADLKNTDSPLEYVNESEGLEYRPKIYVGQSFDEMKERANAFLVDAGLLLERHGGTTDIAVIQRYLKSVRVIWQTHPQICELRNKLNAVGELLGKSSEDRSREIRTAIQDPESVDDYSLKQFAVLCRTKTEHKNRIANQTKVVAYWLEQKGISSERVYELDQAANLGRPEEMAAVAKGLDNWLRSALVSANATPAPEKTDAKIVFNLGRPLSQNDQDLDLSAIVREWLERPSKHGGPTKEQAKFVRFVLLRRGLRADPADISTGCGFDYLDPRDGCKKMIKRIEKRIGQEPWEILPEDRGEIALVLKRP